MANTPRYRRLVARISQLRRHLLPRTFDTTSTYQAKFYDRAKAFRLIVHAEVEAFVEDRVVEVANDAVRKWLNTGIVTPCIAALLAYQEASSGAPTSILNPPRTGPDHLAERVRRAQTRLNQYAVTHNHGVRERNLLKLLLSVGIDASRLDVPWLTAIDSWAQERGDFAHKSRVAVLNDPKDELDRSIEILKGLAAIDADLSNC